VKLLAMIFAFALLASCATAGNIACTEKICTLPASEFRDLMKSYNDLSEKASRKINKCTADPRRNT
jgi:hypothetical protein